MLIDGPLAVDSRADAINALRRLLACGFGGRCLFDVNKRTITLHFRRTWQGFSDVVLVFAENDAEAYRANDSINEMNPLDIVTLPNLPQECVGSVVEVVKAVLSWPDPPSWTSHFPSTAPGTSLPGAHSAPD